MGKRAAFILVAVSILAGAAFGQNFTGTYSLAAGTTKLTLVLKQGAAGQVTGTLSSSTGASFKLDGKIQDDIVTGTCQGQAGTSQFEASFEGQLLVFTLMETGPNGEVNSRSLEFTRSGGGGGSTSDALGLPPGAGGAAAAKPRGQGQAVPPPPPPAPSEPARPSGGNNVVSVPELGCSFAIPPGWNGQKQGQGIFLTSTNYKGFITVQRHSYTSVQQMAAEASKGIVDPSSNINLMPVSPFQPFGKAGMVAEFGGVFQGQKARAFAVGLIAPRGGGVTIMAATEEAGYSSEYSDLVLAIAGSLSFLPGAAAGGAPVPGPGGAGGGVASNSDLMSYFTGEYYYYSSGSTISGGAGTERTITLCPDGNFRDSSEFSANGAGQWGGVNSQAGWGRWAIQGDKSQGMILVTYPDGRSKQIPYRVVSKQEQTISFDGVTYAFAGKAKCR